MHYEKHESDGQDENLAKYMEHRLELSAAWRILLGLESAAPDTAIVSDTPVLKNDPWAALLQTQDIQVIDLQQLHAQVVTLDERDVERALNTIQEQ